MKTAIVICIDANYVEAAAVFLESLSDNYHYRDDLDVVCVMSKEDSGAFAELERLPVLNKSIDLKLVEAPEADFEWLKDLTYDNQKITPSMWHRLFLGSILKDYDKAIYFDPDILIVDNIQPILDHPMYNKFMATYDTIGVPYLYKLHRGDTSHFVTGVLIMDLNWWRSSGIEDKFKTDLLTDGPHELLDEYLLNKYLKEFWYPLPVSFNFHAFMYDEYGVPNWDSTYLPDHYYKHVIAFHFAGPIKPWNNLAGEDTSRLGAEWRRRRDLLKTKRSPRGLGGGKRSE